MQASVLKRNQQKQGSVRKKRSENPPVPGPGLCAGKCSKKSLGGWTCVANIRIYYTATCSKYSYVELIFRTICGVEKFLGADWWEVREMVQR